MRIAYTYWLSLAQQGTVVGFDVPWVYPVLAWVPILLAGIAGVEALPVLWLVLIAVLNAVAVAALAASGERGIRGAWLWLLLLVALGPVAIARIDSIAVPIAILGVCAAWAGRPWLAATAWTVGAWMKIAPGALWIAALVAERRRLPILLPGVVVSSVVVAAALAAGAGANVFSFITWQSSRGLQVEAVLATPLHLAGVPLEYDEQQMTFQMTGEAAAAIARFATPLLVCVVAAIAVLGFVAARRGAHRESVQAWLATALTAALIVMNSVGSPQFLTWLAAPAILLAAERAWRTVGLIVGLSAVTQAIFPWLYGPVLSQDAVGITPLVVRNVGMLALLVVAMVSLTRLAVARHAVVTHSPSASAISGDR